MMNLRSNILFFADKLPPLAGGMEMHAGYFIEYFKNHPKFPLLAVVTKDETGNDRVIANSEYRFANINDFAEQVGIVFFNSGRWIEELQQIRKLFPMARFFYRTGGNEILKAPLVKANFPDHKMRQSYWVNAINDNIDILITNSRYTEGRLRNLGVKIPFRLVVGGVNVECLRNMAVKKNEQTTIFCAARFVPYKNHSLMVSVWKELMLRGLNFKVKLAGDGPLLDSIKLQVKQDGLESFVEFLGVLDNFQTCREIFNADIYMQLSTDKITEVPGGSYVHSEGMGRSILEALSAGTFVIAGNSGALSEIINESNGLLLNSKNVDYIAGKVESVIRHPVPKAKVKHKYDWSKVFTKYEKLFG